MVRFSVEDDWLVDIVADTTDIKRDAPAPVLLAIPPESAHVLALQQVPILSRAHVI